ncbi:MAG: zinc ribbon domain-containing protein [Deltaproteobacteria bacterium]|nr:zinc ribbon domain-containing protein [Deltaproteobacteria bacterium]
MPIYEYRCNACGRDFEQWRRITDDSRPACSACGSLDVHRQVSMSSFQLKGSGWYVTDYAGKKTNSTSHKEEKTETAPSATDKSTDKSTDKRADKRADKSDGVAKEPARAAGTTGTA